MKYNIYFNGFWGGFFDGTNPTSIDCFTLIFDAVPCMTNNYSIVDNINDANVLVETLFADSVVYHKNWHKTILYSGESYNYTYYNGNSNYDIYLTCTDPGKGGVYIPVPLSYVYMKYDYGMKRLMERPLITTVPAKFCFFAVTNPIGHARNNMFYLLNTYKRIDSFGRHLNNMGDELISSDYGKEDFINKMRKYKFVICFENTKIEEYLTEKIVNPYYAHIIPIYWGTHHVKDIFNMDSMLFLEDESEESYYKLVRRIVEIDNNDELYLRMVNQPVFTDANLEYWKQHYSLKTIGNKISQGIVGVL